MTKVPDCYWLRGAHADCPNENRLSARASSRCAMKLDVTENQNNISIATTIAELIRARIKAETGLNASAGISYCKVLAMTASDLNMPNVQKIACNPAWTIDGKGVRPSTSDTGLRRWL